MDMRKKNIAVCFLFALLLAGGFALCILLPDKSYSDSERRSLAAMPGLRADTVWSGQFMDAFEEYAADAFPFRDQFRTIKALTADAVFGRKDNNGIYITDGFIAAMEYPANENAMERAVQRFRYICGKYLTEENKVFLSVIPDKNCYLAQESGHLSMDYADFERQMAQKADFAKYIPVSDLLEKDDYYKTDTHWRQEKITDAARRLAEAMGTEITQSYEVHTLKQDFHGVYYGQAALPLQAEKLCYLTNESIDGCTVYDWQNGKEIPVYDMEKAAGRDPYEMFLAGSVSLLTIENPKARNNRRLVVFRDSFGSSMAPLLVSGYSRITLVDIRYIHPDYLGRFIDFAGCDILFLYSSLVINNSETLK